MGPERHKRPSNYLNIEAYFNSYLAYYFPLHLPELYWILDQGKKKNFSITPKRVLDVGCGPETLSISLMLWLQKNNLPFPEEIVLWDQSERALKFAKEKIKLISKTTKVRFEKVHLPKMPRDEDFDLILMGHLLNEWGAGPRFRPKKIELLQNILKLLSVDGSFIVIEPPLREPTLDLMEIRDELIENDFQVVAPCPQSSRICPMLDASLGWCYTQPYRNLFKEEGFTEFDKKIEKLLHIQLTHQSFSYLWVRPTKGKLKETHVAVTDKNSPRHKLCLKEGVIDDTKKASFYRGEIKIDQD